MLLCQRNFLLEADLTLHGLIGKAAVFPSVPAARLSDHLVLNGLRISVQDLAFCESSVGFVIACCSEGGDLFVVVEELLFVKRVSTHSDAWRPPRQDGQLKVWAATR